jgi:hypothetical protein
VDGGVEVTFISDVSQCAYVATPVNTSSQAIQVFTAGGHQGPNGVYVEVKNQGGGVLPGSFFHLVVICDASKVKFAVVGYGSDLVRATPGTKLTPVGPGQYNVTFSAAVNECAYLATVGDPGNAVVFAPAGVYTGSGPNSKTVYVETKDPEGGLESAVPFHLVAICASTPNTHIAVVNASGLITRGTALTSAFEGATGEYAVVTRANITPTCATVATRGSVDKTAPSMPATVELTSGPAANSIGIQVRDPLFFGGNLINQAFHSATVCN